MTKLTLIPDQLSTIVRTMGWENVGVAAFIHCYENLEQYAPRTIEKKENQ